ncbi:MAG: hypothetical protein LBJ21_01660 [Acidobacteriota bacterium]|jgi:hypothetical protein|nr:hypothetical protein [Acidobacteriota bacterium]
MRELTFEEMDSVSGGFFDFGPNLFKVAVEYLLDNREAYFNALIRYTAQYGGLYTPVYGQGS